jgi:hypothetical protein
VEKEDVKRELVHDLRTFLWMFEQEGYSREAMQGVLARLERVLEDDAYQIGGDIERHVKKMVQDCESYAKGVGDPKQIVQDLDQLRKDLERRT